MQLLHCSGLSAPQFVSLSLLLKPTIISNGVNQQQNVCIDMVEPMMIASPLATVSQLQALQSLKELHTYLSGIIRAASLPRSDGLAMDFLKEDEKSLYESIIQTFRPIGAAGLGLQYRLLRTNGNDNTAMSKIASLVLSSNKNNAASTKIDASVGMLGVVICVGVSGSPYAHCANSVQYTMGQRMSDSMAFLASSKVEDASTAKALLSSFILYDDEHRKTNDMFRAPDLLIVPEPSDSNAPGVRNLLSPMGIISPIADLGRKTQRFAKRGVGKGAGAIDGDSNDGAPPTEIGFPLSLDLGSADAARVMTLRLSVLSVAESDSHLRKYEKSGAERKANLDLVGSSKSKFRRTRKGETRDADFDNFDYKGPAKVVVKRKDAVAPAKAIPALAPAPESVSDNTPKLALKSAKKDTRARRSSRHSLSKSVATFDDDSSHQAPQRTNSGGNKGFDPFTSELKLPKARRRKSQLQFDDEQSHVSGQHEGNSVASQGRLTMNVALNEDLTCSYKLSQLSSCNVEGSIQVSIKSTSRSAPAPFVLYIRDPAKHIENISENKSIVQDISPSLQRSSETERARFKFNVNIPKLDAYYALMKYKCVGELRPVPIRVQTKIKSGDGVCRVALQISSNPNNAGNLTDLTIVMGVPDKVRGESLQTIPPGGVWDQGKSSVIWCVSELGSGEKFQLQAKLEMIKPDIPAADLNFPVLVRCQCLQSQLSDVDVEVKDINDSAEIATKIVKRYRLSHREKHA